MPHYHFHVQDGGLSLEPDGMLLTDAHEARTQAVRFAADLLRDEPPGLWADGRWSMTVTDERELPLFSLTMIATTAPDAYSSIPKFNPRDTLGSTNASKT
ncbi:DUF6894 family protein [Sphingomonas sp. 1P08PE]|uniref:DUF6894 family protein n=1 Tax=Sphingomonas sp. 1P08PE TaxID=554122 RepID=UPI0039A02ED6